MLGAPSDIHDLPECPAVVALPTSDPPAMADELPGDDSERDAAAHARKSRQNFSATQLAILECVFNTTPLPRKAVRAQLAEQLALPHRSVQVWFQNRRQKWKTTYRATLMSAVQQQQQEQQQQQQQTATAPGAGAQTSPNGVAAGAPASLPAPGTTSAGAPAAAPAAAHTGSMAQLQRRWQEQWGAHVHAQLALQQQQQQQFMRSQEGNSGHSANAACAKAAPPPAVPPATVAGAQPDAPAIAPDVGESTAACEGLLLLSSFAQVEASHCQHASGLSSAPA
ncbi:hypothetical protein KFE25_004863 [Diacronema lutheri]|uniref:Homeobox domain-containing protein n=1 Tax=Diacronema lutheri TaxID=2081491 RepID=A0A8J5XKS7_DIALT|nr:hypothetical protein KFE25_004863 [Diacronema lutheri]